MSKRTEIAQLLAEPKIGEKVTVMGWVRAFRSNRFIALNDGTGMKNVQVVIDFENMDEEVLKKINFHACLKAVGTLQESQGAGQSVEIIADEVEILGESDPEVYPLQPKRQTMEFLRDKAHLRMRTNTFSAVFRIRHAVAYAVHKYFNDKGYYYLHTPIVTGSDAEGAGEMFQVTTLNLSNPPLKNPILDQVASQFYERIVNALTLVGITLEEINGKIREIDKNLTLKSIVLANPSQIKTLIENEELKKLNYLISKIFNDIKEHVFEIRLASNGNKLAYIPHELIGDLGFDEAKKISRDYPGIRFLELSFYNFKIISKTNRTSPNSTIDFSEDFFGKATNLTVSGQLQAEIGALSMGKVYTFGPTFRAENSHTTRHLSEFWMIEPEVAFFDIFDDMDLAEDFVKYLINYVLDNYPDDLAFLDQRIQQEEKNMPKEKRRPMGLVEMLRFVVDNDFERITYSEAINILRNSKPFKKGRFEFEPTWGADLQAEHERFLVEKKFKKPVIVRDYPKDIKAFYMRINDDDKTVAAMDVLFPFIGEVIGGSQREERIDILKSRMADMDIPEEELWWYLELRKFGGAPHAGFGLGFERMVLFITGMTNIRDVIPFPRAPKTAEF